ncbi:MAG TPA: amidohydrolase family protein [Actinomycetota bacterium]
MWPIAMGTDAGTPGNHHGSNAFECMLMVEETGPTPEESILASTGEPARLLGRQGELGAIQEGAFADIIGMGANPLQDIGELTRIGFVMKGGSVVRHDR